jgi:hypothetical protein
MSFLTLFFAQAAQAAFIYTIDRSGPCTECSGDVSVKGTIEVDKLGNLAVSNFVNWNLTFNSINYANTILDPTNSSVSFFGKVGSIVATATELAFYIPEENSVDEFLFTIEDSLAFPFIVNWVLQGGGRGNLAQEFVSNNLEFVRGQPFNQAVVNSTSNSLIVSIPIAEVSEPSAIVLFSLSFLGLVLARRKKVWSRESFV